MEASDPHAHQPDAEGTETAPVSPAEPEQAEPEQPPQQEPPVMEPAQAESSPESPPSTSEGAAPEQEQQAEQEAETRQEEESANEEADQDQPAEEAEASGVLVGTTTEQAPGVGGIGDHPAPAAMRDPETGELRVAGQPPHSASGVAPTEEEAQEVAGGATDEENLEKLNAVTEPDQTPIERPDIGTE